MAVEAALNCLEDFDRERIDGVLFASTSSPYREKQGAALIAAVADLKKDIITGDYANTLRAGTSAFRAALASVKSGEAGNILVTAADNRLPYPRSGFEQAFGDAAAALMIGDEDVAVEIEDSYSLSDELTDIWRTDDSKYVQNWEDRWVLMHGVSANTVTAVSGLMEKNDLKPGDFNRAVIFAPDVRTHQGLMRRLGFKPEQVQDPLLNNVGNAGAAHSILMLAAALEDAKPGDRLIWSSYGDGADAFILRITDRIERLQNRRSVKRHLESRKELSSYEKYLSYRELLDKPDQAGFRGGSSATAMWRTRNWVLSLHGSKCRQCGLITFPIQRVCYQCMSKDDYEEVRMYDKKAKLFTYSLDNLAGGIDPPLVQACLDFEGGGRMYCVMTDVDASTVDVDMPLEMTFRMIHKGAGFNNYFWKCRPPR
jgi:3-hydroxy-3-methylglutaryl CoA synthase